MDSAFHQEAKQQAIQLNFQNEESVKQRQLASEDLASADALRKCALEKQYEQQSNGLLRKSLQCTLESMEHAHKSVEAADEGGSLILGYDAERRKTLTRSHNNGWHQREQEKAGVDIYSKEDVQEVERMVKPSNPSAYNGVRYTRQKLSAPEVERAIAIASEGLIRLNEMAEQENLVFRDRDGNPVRISY